MDGSELTRRDVLGLIAGCIIAGTSRPGIGAESLAAKPGDLLVRMARRLYPHEALADRIYVEALAPLHAALAEQPSLAGSLSAGRRALNDAAGGDWLAADGETQVAALRSIEDTPFFRTVRDAARDELYNHPDVWKLIGFEGSSVEFGGYIDRGFADIDWLPED